MKRERLESAVVENRAVYITLRQQFEIAKIDEAKEKLLINILDTAEPAVKKTKPKRTLIVVLSFFAGLVLAIPFAIYFDRKQLKKLIFLLKTRLFKNSFIQAFH